MEKKKVICSLIGSIWLTVLLYIFLHESGHVLVGMLCGAKIIEFNLLEAYVICEGGKFTNIAIACFYMAGMLVSLAVSWAYLLFYRSNSKFIFYNIFSAFFVIMCTFSALAWVIVPIIYMVGIPNPNDDIVKFMDCTEIHPLIVSLGASILIAISLLGIWHKQVFKNYVHTMKRIKCEGVNKVMGNLIGNKERRLRRH